MNRIKCVAVGDCVGKTSLLLTYTTGHFPDRYLPGGEFDDHCVRVLVDGEPYTLALFDTPGQEEYDRSRPLNYPDTDVFLVCFALNHRDSYDNIAERWALEVKHFGPQSPIVLVGTRLDLRDEAKKMHISYVEGLQLQREINAVKYLECSSKTQEGVKDVFDVVIRTALGLLVYAGKRLFL